MPLPNDDPTRNRFPEQEEIIHAIEVAIEDIRKIKEKLLPELAVTVERLHQLEGILEYLAKMSKGYQ